MKNALWILLTGALLAATLPAQCPRVLLVPAGCGAQAKHLMSGARPQRDAIGARGRMQRRERVIGIDVGQVTHALLLDKMA